MSGKRVYIAGPFDKKEELREIAEKVQQEGHSIASKWLWRDETDMTLEEVAKVDIMDVAMCNVFVACTEPPGSGYSTGGRHFEAGWIYNNIRAERQELYLLGPAENIFYNLPGWEKVDSIEDLLSRLRVG